MKPGTTGKEDVAEGLAAPAEGAGTAWVEDELAVLDHHLLLSRTLLFAEEAEGVTKLEKRFFGCTLELFGKLEELSDADALNNADVNLAGEQLGALVLEQLFELVHEDNEIERIEACFDEVVGFQAGEVVTRLHGVEGGAGHGDAGVGAGVLLARELGEDGKLPIEPHLLGLVAHDLAGAGSGDGAWGDEGDQRDFDIEIVADRGGNFARLRNVC